MKTLWIFENSYYVPAKSFFPSRPWTYSVSFHHFSRDSPTGSRTGRHDLLSFEQTPQCLASWLRNSWYSENVRWSELKWPPHANPKPQENSPPFQGNAEKVFMGRNYQHGSPRRHSAPLHFLWSSAGSEQGSACRHGFPESHSSHVIIPTHHLGLRLLHLCSEIYFLTSFYKQTRMF